MNYLKDGERVVAQSARPILFDAARGGFSVAELNAIFSQPGLTAENEPSVPASISRLQLILGMTSAGLITAEEGVSAAAGTAIPSVVEAVFASLPSAEATGARIRWNAMTMVERANPLVAAVAAAAFKTDSEMDQYFRDWSVL